MTTILILVAENTIVAVHAGSNILLTMCRSHNQSHLFPEGLERGGGDTRDMDAAKAACNSVTSRTNQVSRESSTAGRGNYAH